jgi:hypothetical protein
MANHSEQTLLESDSQFEASWGSRSRKGRGTYEQDEFIFNRGDEPYNGSAGKLRLMSRKGGDRVLVKLFSDLDGNGRFSTDELIFGGSQDGDGIYDRLNGSMGKIRWNYNDCTPCLMRPFHDLVLNPVGSKKVGFFSFGFLSHENNIQRIEWPTGLAFDEIIGNEPIAIVKGTKRSDNFDIESGAGYKVIKKFNPLQDQITFCGCSATKLDTYYGNTYISKDGDLEAIVKGVEADGLSINGNTIVGI